MTRDEARAKVDTAGAEWCDSGLANLDWAASNDIEITAWLLTNGLIESITKGGTVKYVGVVKYEHL